MDNDDFLEQLIQLAEDRLEENLRLERVVFLVTEGLGGGGSNGGSGDLGMVVAEIR